MHHLEMRNWPFSLLVAGLVVALPSGGAAFAAEAGKISAPVRENTSLRNESRRAIAKGLAWLQKNQDAKGFWSTADHPAVTALVLVAAQGDPTRASNSGHAEFVNRGDRKSVV